LGITELTGLKKTKAKNYYSQTGTLIKSALLGYCLMWPVLVFGQAGSSAPLKNLSAVDSLASGSAFLEETVLPRGVLKLATEERFLFWVELDAGKLHVLEVNAEGGMDTRQIIPISIGKNGFGKNLEGDRKTPVGVYRMTSFLTDEQLIDYYGLGAFPLNYPNVIDRQVGRTGSGIWLHGLPKGVASRPLWDSDGCVVIANDSLSELQQYITTGISHIVLSDDALTWVGRSEVELRRNSLADAFEAWRQSWESKDNAAYLDFYADDFDDFMRRKSQWAEYKSRVNDNKNWIRVSTSKVSFYADLKQPELVTVRYYQDYESSNYTWRGWKEQLWRESSLGWQIIYEGNG
jgi:murein L,D-transpeptidase YafK